MDTTTTYHDTAGRYADAVRALFAGSVAHAGERAGTAPVPLPELTSSAEALVPLSVELTGVAATQLAADDSDLRIQASIGLLAKALTDLEVSKALFSAAEQGDGRDERSRGTAEIERSSTVTRPAHLDDTLLLLLGEEAKAPELAKRGPELPTTVKAARVYLAEDTQAVLMLIRDRAASAGWEALGGVGKLGAGKLAEAAGLVGMEAAAALGQAAQLTRLYELVRAFLGRAYASLQALLGPALAQMIGEQVVGWIKEAGSGKKFAGLLERLYDTKAAGVALVKLAAESAAGLSEYIAAIQGVDALESAYRKQVEIVGKILKAFTFVAIVPAVALPQGRLLMAAAYILVGGYIVLAGADYVDAQHLTVSDCVPGVRRVVEMNLTPA